MSQETLAEVRSVITYDSYKKYFMFCLFKRKSYKLFLVLYGVILSIVTLVALFSIINFGFQFINTTALVIALVLGFFILYSVVFVPKKYYKTAKQFAENSTTYRFTLECLEVESKSDESSSNSSIRYDAFHRIYELDEVIYIFISNIQAFIVPKNDIPEETMKQLRGIFKSKLGKKYHNYCNK